MILLSLFIFSITISGVSAQDAEIISNGENITIPNEELLIEEVNTIYINDTGGNDDWDGSSWDKAKKSIRNATDSAGDNWNIIIANGIYKGENNTNILINKNLTIFGESQENTIIDAENLNQLFNIANGVNVNIHNLTLKKMVIQIIMVELFIIKVI